MRILFSIVINALILFAITYLLSANPDKGVVDGVVLGCDGCGFNSLQAWKTYIIGGIILGIINVTIKPLLKLLSLPFYLIFFSLVGFIVNGILLKLFDYIVNVVLQIPGISYTINGTVNFIIAVAIFTFLNMFYSLIFSKK
ncbi:MAG: phage holin family protein [Candidatus Gracilibacteria bacterium]|nr:phage holin family protein [Candidatus Gracilibacteria bacterium]MDQ7022506.1 phage holin family protein [Candidatus Gracilibacteria bacterium]